MHYYPHHIGDFIKDTARLNDAQSMAYLRLLWKYYDEEAPLSDRPEKLAFSVGASLADVLLILEHFFNFDGKSYRHSRCDKVLEEYKKKSEKASKSANARWNKASAMRTHSERKANEQFSDANQEPITNNQEPKTKREKARGSRLPQDWAMDSEHEAFCRSERPDLIPAEVEARFKDYWIAQTGARGVKLDWMATWRNWVRNERHRPVKSLPESFRERERREQIRQWEEMTGRVHPDRQGMVIDAESHSLEIGYVDSQGH